MKKLNGYFTLFMEESNRKARIMLKTANKLHQLPWITLLFGVAALYSALLPEGQLAYFQYDRSAILSGELWRLFSGHLVHWSASHLSWDLLVFMAAGGFLEWYRRSLLCAALLVSTCFVSLGLLLFQPGMNLYRGLSGIDMALVTLFCLEAIRYCRVRRNNRLVAGWMVFLTLCLLKPFVEIVSGHSLFVDTFAPGVEGSPLAHLLGVASAFLLSGAICLWRKVWHAGRCNHSSLSRKPSEISIS